MTLKKALAIGIEDYKSIIDKPYYYVDKTLMIKDLLDKGGAVNLFTRPRRFGKTLTLSMLKTYFETDTDVDGSVTDNGHYFDGMKIMNEGEEYTRHQGQYPVILLSLKSAKQPNFEMAYDCLKEQVSLEYKRHSYILDADCIFPEEKEKYREIMVQKGSDSAYATSLAFLSKCLQRYHQKKVIILIDEYDVPLENAYFRGFYDRMIDFVRSLFESALKTNDSLEFAVITGCLRIGRESIFTGLNNLKIISVLDNSFAEYFGFIQPEVEKMLEYYEIENKTQEMRSWYDGYLFGETEVYNPWSVINYVDGIVNNGLRYPKPYWSNTSSNSIIRELVEGADTGVKKEIEELIAGGSIEKPVHEEITYADIHKSQDNLWNFLFFTGYLKKTRERMEERITYLTLAIPNEEVLYIYENTIREWFQHNIKQTDCSSFYRAIVNGNCEEIEAFVNRQLAGSISYFDNAENFYHGYFLGILSGLEGYEIDSNKEHGNGRPDIVLSPMNPKEPAVILEFKLAEKFTQMEAKCAAALEQIDRLHYDADLIDMGYRTILKYGVCFCRKNCMVRKK